ncbi:MAG: hypothetical protein NPIRA04_01700 [Nitrospirales bacterium]|nr:MAG: hypothetical protein NPIRA04_01700 [Nitrospirales bacterium]
MLQKFQKKRKPLIVTHSSSLFFQQRHFMTLKKFLLTLIVGTGMFFQTLLLPMPVFSESEKVYPEGDKEYFKALLELEKDEAYKEFLMKSVSYAGDKKVDYIDYKGVRPTVNGEGAESTDTGTDAAHFRKQTYQAMRNMDWFRKNNYQNFIRNVGQNIYPVIIASDYEPGKEGVGSTYYLYRRDRPVETVTPTSVMYEMEKILSHIPMGVFILISPYFDNVANRPEGWEEPLVEYKKHVENIKDVLKKSDMSQATSGRAITMLDMVNTYLQDCIANGAGDEKSYSAFAHKIIPHIAEAMKAAMELQIQAGLSALSQWKQKLGPQEWDKLHVLIPVVWPVAQGNPRRQLFEHLMTPERAKTNIFEVHARSHDEARTTLGRIKGDSVMASLTFDKDTHFGMMSYLRLSSPTDLVQGASKEELKKYPKTKADILQMKTPPQQLRR